MLGLLIGCMVTWCRHTGLRFRVDWCLVNTISAGCKTPFFITTMMTDYDDTDTKTTQSEEAKIQSGRSSKPCKKGMKCKKSNCKFHHPWDDAPAGEEKDEKDKTNYKQLKLKLECEAMEISNARNRTIHGSGAEPAKWGQDANKLALENERNRVANTFVERHEEYKLERAKVEINKLANDVILSQEKLALDKQAELNKDSKLQLDAKKLKLDHEVALRKLDMEEKANAAKLSHQSFESQMSEARLSMEKQQTADRLLLAKASHVLEEKKIMISECKMELEQLRFKAEQAELESKSCKGQVIAQQLEYLQANPPKFNILQFLLGINCKNLVVADDYDYCDVNVNNAIVKVKLDKQLSSEDYAIPMHGTFDMLASTDIVLHTSNCGLFVWTEKCHLKPTNRRQIIRTDVATHTHGTWFQHNGDYIALTGCPKSRLRACAYTLFHKFLTNKLMVDHTNLEFQITRLYRRSYGDHPQLEGFAREILAEPWVYDLTGKYWDTRIATTEKEVELKAKAIASSSLPTYASLEQLEAERTSTLLKWTSLLTIGVPLLALGSWVASEIIKPVYNSTLTDSVRENKPIKKIKEYGRIYSDKNHYAQLVDQTVNGLAAGLLVPCSSRRYPKRTYNKLNRPLPPQSPSSRIVMPAQTRPPPDTTIENFGLNLQDISFVVPTTSDENLEAALAIRMGFERVSDEKLNDEFRSWLLDTIDSYDPLYFDFPTFEDYKDHNWSRGLYERIAKCDKRLTPALTEATIIMKIEAYLGKDEDNNKPRMIWSFSDSYLYTYAPYCSRLGKVLKERFMSRNDTMTYVCGENPDTIGALADEMDELPYIYEFDVSNWDGSMSSTVLECEAYFFQNICPEMPEKELFIHRWTNPKGKSRSGIEYSADYGRASGALLTGPMNSMTNKWVVDFLMSLIKREHPDLKYKGMVNGDDGVVATSVKLDVDYVVKYYEGLGMKVEVLEHDSMSKASFCSGLFWKVGGKYKFGNLPFRQLAKFGMNYHNHPPSKHKGLLYGTAKSLLCTAGHVPIISTFLRAICRTAEASGIRPIYDRSQSYPGKISGGCTMFPLADTYQQFSERYGMAIEVIEIYENVIDALVDINKFPMTSYDELLRNCTLVDFPNYSDPCEPVIKDPYVHMTMVAPAEEEMYKLVRSREIGLVAAAEEFGQMEVKEGSPDYVVFLHTFFTVASSISLPLGVTLHSSWNRLAAHSQGLTACARRGRRKTTVKIQAPPVQVSVSTKRKKKGKRRRRRRAKGKHPGGKFAVARMNPFLPEAEGVKIPDSFRFPTSTLTGRSIGNFTTPMNSWATGVVYGFTPWPTRYRYAPSAVDINGNITWSSGTVTQASMYTTFNANIETFRVVAWGLRLIPTVNLTNCNGIITIAHIPGDISTSQNSATEYPSSRSAAAQSPYWSEIPIYQGLAKPMIIPGRPLDETCYEFHDPTYPSAPSPYGQDHTGWCNIMVMISGVPQNTSIMDIEWVAHFEIIPKPSVALLVDAKSEPLSYPALQSVANMEEDVPVVADEESLLLDMMELGMDFIAPGSGRKIKTAAKSVYKMYRDHNPMFEESKEP